MSGITNSEIESETTNLTEANVHLNGRKPQYDTETKTEIQTDILNMETEILTQMQTEMQIEMQADIKTQKEIEKEIEKEIALDTLIMPTTTATTTATTTTATATTRRCRLRNNSSIAKEEFLGTDASSPQGQEVRFLHSQLLNCHNYSQ